MKTLNRLAVTIVLMAMTSTSAFAADTFATMSYPLGVNVDGTYIPSSMYLNFSIKPYNVPLDRFAAGELDARERAFVSFMSAVRTKEYARAEALLASPRPAALAKRQGTQVVRAETRTA